jgi:hypothetical protein
MERAVSEKTEDKHDPAMIWTGWLKRGESPGTIVGELKDHWGWVVTLAGSLDKEGGGYALQGRLGAAPATLRVEAIDDPITKDG